MNLKKVQFACEILTEQFNHWTLFSVALLFMCATSGDTGIFTPNVWPWIVCALFPFALFMIRSKFQQISGFVLLHIAVIGVAFLIPTSNIVYRCIYVGTAVYYVINSLHLRYKKNSIYSRMISVPLAFGLFFASSLSANIMIGKKWAAYYLISMIVSMALFYVILYIQRYLDFLNVNKSSAGYMPARDMFRSGINLVLWFTGGCVVFFLLSMFTNVMGDLLTVISDAFMKLLKYLFSLLPESDYVEQPIEKDEYDVSGGLLGLGRQETFWLWDLLQFVFLVALFIVIVWLLIKLILKLIEFIQGHFKATRKTEMEEDDSIDIREKIEIEKRPERKRKNPFDRFSPTARIRHLYKKKLLNATVGMSSSDTDKLGIYTASEWEGKLQTNGMANIYEQARYSTREMTPTDVKKMRDACKASDESYTI